MTTQTFTCGACGMEAASEIVIEDSVSIKHEGVVHDLKVNVPAFVCANCGETSFDFRADQLVRRALRTKLGLLQPDEIRSIRNQFHIRQEDIWAKTGIAIETISRWENDRTIQSKSHDCLLRYYFEEVIGSAAALKTWTTYQTAPEAPWLCWAVDPVSQPASPALSARRPEDCQFALAA